MLDIFTLNKDAHFFLALEINSYICNWFSDITFDYMKRLIILILLPLWFSLAGQTLTAFRGEVPNGYNFWVSTPVKYDSLQDSQPVILFLHGASLCGNNLERVRRYGPLHALAMGRQIDALIIAPQNPGGAWKPEKINNVVDWVFAHYRCDTNRLYVIGMSLGGYGTIDYSAVYPHRIAAAVAMCGGGNPKSYCGLNELPLWIMHGTADRAVGISQSQKVIRAMTQCGDTSRLRFTKLAGVSHSGLARAFYLPEVYDWLFLHRLDTPERPVSREYDLTPARLGDAYRNLDRKANHLTVNNKKVSSADTSTSEAVDTETANGEPQYYIIKKGDTLGAIARRHHTTVRALCRLNGMTEKTVLRIGKKIRIR